MDIKNLKTQLATLTNIADGLSPTPSPEEIQKRCDLIKQLKTSEGKVALVTANYKQIATSLGMPKASRAVAKACASNRIAVAIPCHRVIASSGALSGYAWGVERKQVLLDREKI